MERVDQYAHVADRLTRQEKTMDLDDIDSLTDEQISNYQEALAVELNRRLRIASIPQQLRELVADARTGGEIPDSTLRSVFEDAMNTDID